MKKRACILLMLFVALPIAVLFLGKKTLYLPVRTEVYFSSTEADESLRNEIDYEYHWFGYLKELKYKNYWGRYTFYIDTNIWGNVTSCQGGLQISDDVLDVVDKTYTYRWDGKILKSTSYGDSLERAYDFWGRLVCVKKVTDAKHWRGGNTYMIRYHYSKLGKLVSVSSYKVTEDTETLSASIQFDYNRQGQRVAETYYNSSGNVIRQTTYSYNGNETIIDTRKDIFFDTLTYDHAGNLIENSDSYNDYSSKTTYVHTYRKILVPLWLPRRAYVYTASTPPLGFVDQYYLINIDP